VSSKLSVAQHLLTQTYPALQDPKILLSVCQNTLYAIEDALTESLEEARRTKQIPPYSETFTGKLQAFREHLAKKKGVGPIDFMLISELQELVAQHDSSPMEFRRKNAYVMADNDYTLHTLTAEKAKTFIQRAKSLISRL